MWHLWLTDFYLELLAILQGETVPATWWINSYIQSCVPLACLHTVECVFRLYLSVICLVMQPAILPTETFGKQLSAMTGEGKSETI